MSARIQVEEALAACRSVRNFRGVRTSVYPDDPDWCRGCELLATHGVVLDWYPPACRSELIQKSHSVSRARSCAAGRAIDLDLPRARVRDRSTARFHVPAAFGAAATPGGLEGFKRAALKFPKVQQLHAPLQMSG